jgi:uncharacterized phiE125 gp8 family phage protein
MTVKLIGQKSNKEFYKIPTLKLKTAPADLPVTLEQVKQYLSMDEDNNDFNSILIRFITGAVRRIEDYTNIKMITQDWYQYHYDWPLIEDYIELRLNPVQSITAINYKLSGASGYTEWSSSEYELDESAEPARLWVKDEYSWPAEALSDIKPIQIDFKVGYGDEGDDCDPELAVAVMQIVEHWFENRGVIVTGTIVANIPLSAQSIMDSKRIIFY